MSAPASSHAKPPVVAEPNSKRARTENGSDASSSSSAAAASSSSAAAAAAPFVNPSDWPPAGPIDLSTADLPHDSADTEWWYVNGHCIDPATKHDLSFFASFFRICKAVHADGTLSVEHTHAQCHSAAAPLERMCEQFVSPRIRIVLTAMFLASKLYCVFGHSEHAHALNWAIVDVTAGTYHADPVLDAATPEILRKQLADGTYDLDSRMSRAFMEVVNKGTKHTHQRKTEYEFPTLVSALEADTFHSLRIRRLSLSSSQATFLSPIACSPVRSPCQRTSCRSTMTPTPSPRISRLVITSSIAPTPTRRSRSHLNSHHSSHQRGKRTMESSRLD